MTSRTRSFMAFHFSSPSDSPSFLFKYLLCCLSQHWMTPKKNLIYFEPIFINNSFRNEIANNASFEQFSFRGKRDIKHFIIFIDLSDTIRNNNRTNIFFFSAT